MTESLVTLASRKPATELQRNASLQASNPREDMCECSLTGQGECPLSLCASQPLLACCRAAVAPFTPSDRCTTVRSLLASISGSVVYPTSNQSAMSSPACEGYPTLALELAGGGNADTVAIACIPSFLALLTLSLVVDVSQNGERIIAHFGAGSCVVLGVCCTAGAIPSMMAAVALSLARTLSPDALGTHRRH